MPKVCNPNAQKEKETGIVKSWALIGSKYTGIRRHGWISEEYYRWVQDWHASDFTHLPGGGPAPVLDMYKLYCLFEKSTDKTELERYRLWSGSMSHFIENSAFRNPAEYGPYTIAQMAAADRISTACLKQSGSYAAADGQVYSLENYNTDPRCPRTILGDTIIVSAVYKTSHPGSYEFCA
jgi:hypothetical protein